MKTFNVEYSRDYSKKIKANSEQEATWKFNKLFADKNDANVNITFVTEEIRA
jgi:hypothetical protein